MEPPLANQAHSEGVCLNERFCFTQTWLQIRLLSLTRELVEEEIKAEGEEITIVDEKKANSESRKRSDYYSFNWLKNEPQQAKYAN